MTTATLTPALRATAPAVAARLAAAILLPLAALIARAFLKNPRRVAIILPLWNRLTRAARRFDSVAARLAAGTPFRSSRPGRGSGPRPPVFPAARGWLLADLRHEAAVYANRLDRLLAEPDAAALVAASPQAARILRPICHMLGIAPAVLRRAPRRKPAAPAPRGAPPQDIPAERTRMVPPPCEHVGWPWFPRPSAIPAGFAPPEFPGFISRRE